MADEQNLTESILDALNGVEMTEDLAEGLMDRIRKSSFGGSRTPLDPDQDDTAEDRYDIAMLRGTNSFAELEQIREGTSNLSRQEKYRAYERCIENVPEVKRAVEIYADYTASGSSIEPLPGEDRSSQTYKIEFEGNPKLFKSELAEVEKTTKQAHNAWDIVHDMCLYGDDFVERIFVDGAGLTRLHRLDRLTMYRNEMPGGELHPDRPFEQDATSPHLKPGVDQTENGRILLDQSQVAHYRMLSEIESGYGRSILEHLVPATNELHMIKSALTIARLTKATRKLVYKIDPGTRKGAKRRAFIKRQAQEYKRKRWFDSLTGELRQGRNPMMEDHDIFIDAGEDARTDVSVIPGDPSVSNIKDIEWHYGRLLAGLRIPIAWLGLTGPNIRNVIDEQVLSFMRACRRIRRYYERTTAETYFVGLMAMGIPREKFFGQDLVFEWPGLTTHDDLMWVQLQTARAQLGLLYKEQNIPPEVILMDALGWDEEKANSLVGKMEALEKKRAEMGVAPGQKGRGGPGPGMSPMQRAGGATARIERTREHLISFANGPERDLLEQLSQQDERVADQLEELRFAVQGMLGQVANRWRVVG